jgi:hypothetical protein
VTNRLLFLLLALVLVPAIPSCAALKALRPPARTSPAPAASGTPAPAPPGMPKPNFLQAGIAKISGLFPKKQKPPAALAPQWTGVIRMVNAAEHFVLVEAASSAAAVPGETYLSVAGGAETSTLRMTSLKNPPFLIADIVSGTPSEGEKIYRPKPTAAQPAPSATPKPSDQPKPADPPKKSS